MFNQADWDTPFWPSPFLMVQYLSFHAAIVKDVKDSQGVSKVRCECVELLGKGQKNWTGWVNLAGNPIGGKSGDGDQGVWWPLEPEQTVLLGFLAGHPNALFAIPGPAFQKDQTGSERNKQLTPLEPKAVATADPRDAARVKVFKDSAGNTILFDSRGGHELLAVRDWSGAGDTYHSPGKIEDEKEKEGEESKPRKGARRGVKSVAAGTSEKPSALLKDDVQIIARQDLNGQGTYSVAVDGGGLLYVVGQKERGGKPDCYLVMNASQPIAILGAGNAQIWCDGSDDKVRTTSMIVQNQPPIDVSQGLELILAILEEREKEYGGGGSGDSGGGDSGGTTV